MALTLAGTMFAASSLAAMNGTVFADGKVTLYKDGEVTQQFSGKGLIDENALMVCEGWCAMRLGGISFTADNDTAMAFKKDADGVKVFVKKGTVSFRTSDADKKISFIAPAGQLASTNGYIFNADTEKIASGYYSIDEKTAEIGMQDGGVVLTTSSETITVPQGQAIQLGTSMLAPESTSGLAVESGSMWSSAWWVPAAVGAVVIVGAAGAFDDGSTDQRRTSVSP